MTYTKEQKTLIIFGLIKPFQENVIADVQPSSTIKRTMTAGKTALFNN